ncbi:MAG: serine/threonine protein kinase, partial [Labilithrix sp.]|nr:serine/threonine protein kinase [Labilithrix sp.]
TTVTGPTFSSRPTEPSQPAAPAADPPAVAEKAITAGAALPQATAQARAVALPHPPAPRSDVVPKPNPVEPAPAPSAGPVEAPGFFTLDTYPWTKVTVDGKAVGATPIVRVSLPPGAHSVLMENPAEGIRETATVTIKSGETTSKRLAFDK